MRRWLSLIAMTPLLALLTGCAHVVVDPDGTRHIAGFMVLTLPPAHQDIGADAVRLRSLGLTVTRGHAAGAQLTLGYSDTTIAAMRNDSAISRTTLRRVMREEQPPKEE
ncbi:hypothetical protein [Aquabacterium sp.]|uniref:hypothetical protein n=1 Tax=Aquabacterium sp. TaxID=1872578 RepID=UPI002BC70490|nr:hypothetical protein [Aquabacterium sp.]HSW07131.1 hypothetical protein [Aquabacterium sp.]